MLDFLMWACSHFLRHFTSTHHEPWRQHGQNRPELAGGFQRLTVQAPTKRATPSRTGATDHLVSTRPEHLALGNGINPRPQRRHGSIRRTQSTATLRIFIC